MLAAELRAVSAMALRIPVQQLWLPAVLAVALSPSWASAAQQPAPRQTKPALHGAAGNGGSMTQGAVKQQRGGKLDTTLRTRALSPNGRSRVIITMRDGAAADAVIQSVRGVRGRRLRLLGAQVADVSDADLDKLAKDSRVLRVDHDRPTHGLMERSGATIGATVARSEFGLDGTGIGVAVIDSGVTTWHDDLTVGASGSGQRIVQFVDFVGAQPYPYDDYGHGTHVAGIIAGNGYDSTGARAGVAPGASIIALKVLDAHGGGYISDVIAALDYVVANKDVYNIRVVNLSVGASIRESYTTDPVTLAAKRAVDAGIVVVAAGGNLGKNRQGQLQYGGITAPGNAPWVLTVGASSHMGTTDRSDDTIAGFSSRGPTYLDWAAKPDLVAPGVGIESLASANSTFYAVKEAYLLPGTVSTPSLPYLSLSGTSMASPVVAGAVALMLQANPALTPNAVKGILQYTAQDTAAYDRLTEGAGFLNALGAIRLARFFANPVGRLALSDEYPNGPVAWGRHILWGNHRLGGGLILPDGNAWRTTVTWGAHATDDGDNIVWGTMDDDNIVWGSTGGDDDSIVWGSSTGDDDNIVWGSSDDDNIVWGSNGGDDDNIVWGSSGGDDDNIVWGSDCDGADCDNIVWGSSGPDDDNIVWGSADPDDNIVWGNSDDDNIVWGNSDDDNIVWGNSAVDDIVWGSGVIALEGGGMSGRTAGRRAR
jgi:serine protease AprX